MGLAKKQDRLRTKDAESNRGQSILRLPQIQNPIDSECKTVRMFDDTDILYDYVIAFIFVVNTWIRLFGKSISERWNEKQQPICTSKRREYSTMQKSRKAALEIQRFLKG